MSDLGKNGWSDTNSPSGSKTPKLQPAFRPAGARTTVGRKFFRRRSVAMSKAKERKSCPVCDGVVEPRKHGGGKPKLCCSVECRDINYKNILKERTLYFKNKDATFSCRGCGATFSYHDGQGKQKIFCAPVCRNRFYRRKSQRPLLVCVVCLNEFGAKFRRKCCSKKCATQRRKITMKEWKKLNRRHCTELQNNYYTSSERHELYKKHRSKQLERDAGLDLLVISLETGVL